MERDRNGEKQRERAMSRHVWTTESTYMHADVCVARERQRQRETDTYICLYREKESGGGRETERQREEDKATERQTETERERASTGERRKHTQSVPHIFTTERNPQVAAPCCSMQRATPTSIESNVTHIRHSKGLFPEWHINFSQFAHFSNLCAWRAFAPQRGKAEERFWKNIISATCPRVRKTRAAPTDPAHSSSLQHTP